MCDILAGVPTQPDDLSSCALRVCSVELSCIRRDPIAANRLCAGAIYSMDVFLNLHIGFVLSKSMRQRLLMDGRQVAHLYLFHGTLIVDVLAIVPVIPEARRGALALLSVLFVRASACRIPALCWLRRCECDRRAQAAKLRRSVVELQIIFLASSSSTGTSKVIKGFDYVRLVRLLRVTPLLRRVILQTYRHIGPRWQSP